jgi:hypothetical protein
LSKPFDFDHERSNAMSGDLRNSIMIGGAVVVACFGLTLLEKRAADTTGSDQLRRAELEQELPEENNRAARLKSQSIVVEERIQFSRRVAQELIAERMTLCEAATQLQNLDQSSAPIYLEFYAKVFPRLYPGRSEAERYCRRAIALVESELVLAPVQRAGVIRRLTQEFGLKFSDGVVQAPYLEGAT